MKDLQHAKLIVDYVEPDGTDWLHVMKETEDLHLNCNMLVDNEGNQHPILFNTYKKSSGEGKKIYCIAFDDSIVLEQGTVLTVGPQHWRHEIPDARAIKLEYTRSQSSFSIDDDMEFGLVLDRELKIAVDIDGKVTGTFIDTVEKDCDLEIKTNVSSVLSTQLIEDMLRCVSKEDCYEDQWYDDIGRSMRLFFDDGTVLEYGAIHFCENGNTEEIINRFLRVLDKKNIFGNIHYPQSELLSFR